MRPFFYKKVIFSPKSRKFYQFYVQKKHFKYRFLLEKVNGLCIINKVAL